MAAYGAVFARVYNRECAHFATRVALLILAFYERRPENRAGKEMLDLG